MTNDSTEEDLKGLIETVRGYLISAENALAASEKPSRYYSREDWIRAEKKRLEAMARSAVVQDAVSPNLKTRMHFLEGVEFFSRTHEPEIEDARMLVERIHQIDPGAGNQLDAENVLLVIQKRKKSGKWPWQKISEAWGGAPMADAWRTEWNRHS